MSQPARVAAETDGRRLRSQESRARIVRAMLDRVEAGDLAPSAEQVAARAGVGLRTVFRHFKDMDSLYHEMSLLIETQLRSTFDGPFTSPTWRGRLIELVDRRAAIFERIAPFIRASDANRHNSRYLGGDKARMAGAFRKRLEQQMGPEAGADPLRLEALDMILSYECWARLRSEQGLSPERAREVVAAAVRAVAG